MLQEILRPHKFRDPVHGFIYVSTSEKKIIDSLPFQRLRNIKQLALTHYIYHGAEHTRFGHSIGVMHLTSRAFRSAVSKNTYTFLANGEENERYINWLEQILRLIALTHDLGHAPFSHAGEGLFPMKSEEAGKKKYYKHEDFTESIVLNTEIASFISEIGQAYSDEYGIDYNITPQMICDIYKGTLPGNNSVFTFLKTFMDSELDCDKMDYLLRDSLFCGVSYGRYDLERLLTCLTVFTKSNEPSPFLGIEVGGVQAFEEFVLARYFMFVQVYFHRTRRYFDILLSKTLAELLPNGAFPLEVSEYLEWDDIKVLGLFKDAAESNEKAKQIVSRKSINCVYSTKTHPDGDGLALFNTIGRALKKDVGNTNYKKHFIIDTSADKLPHKIVPRKHSIDDEEVIAIVHKDDRLSTISDESHIINNLTEKINIQRIYANDDYYQQAKSKVDELLIDDTEEDENDG